MGAQVRSFQAFQATLPQRDIGANLGASVHRIRHPGSSGSRPWSTVIRKQLSGLEMRLAKLSL